MKRNQTSLVARVLVASSVLFGAAAAHAATGYSISESQEALIHPGMTMAQVRQLFGHPEDTRYYADQAGPTWRYGVSNAGLSGTYFAVNFGADGKVTSARQSVAMSLT